MRRADGKFHVLHLCSPPLFSRACSPCSQSTALVLPNARCQSRQLPCPCPQPGTPVPGSLLLLSGVSQHLFSLVGGRWLSCMTFTVDLCSRSLYSGLCGCMCHPGFALNGTLQQVATPAVAPSPVSQQAPAPQFPAVLSATARTAEQVAAEVEQQLQLFPQALVQVSSVCG